MTGVALLDQHLLSVLIGLWRSHDALTADGDKRGLLDPAETAENIFAPVRIVDLEHIVQ